MRASRRGTGAEPKDLVLHIGMDKTGTTAIQHYLYTQRRRLEAEDGLLVPLTGMWSDHSHHVIAFAALGMAGHTHAELDGLFAALAREMEASAAPRLILSSECLFKLPVFSPDSPFWDLVARQFGRISAVVYVRRQDKWVESRHRHSVISGKELSIAKLSKPQFSDYKPVIDAWAARLGHDGVTVRPYERGQFAGGDIAQDFRAAIGLGPHEGGRSDLRNETFAWDEVLFRATINHLALPEASLHRLNALLLARPRSDGPDRTMVSPRQATALVTRYEAVNAALAREYLGRADGVLFRDPPPAADPDWREPVLTAEGFDAILRFVSARDDELARQIAAAASALPGEDRSSVPTALARLHGTLRAPTRERRPARGPRGAPPVAQPLDLPALPEARPGLMTRLRGRLLGRTSAILAAPAVQAARRTDDPQPRRILVHFGIRKTGSSSIQETLFDARDALPGLAYVCHGRMANSSLLIRNGFLSESQLADKIARHEDPAAVRRGALRRIEAMCVAARPKPRAVLSAETISDLDATQTAALHGVLASHWQQIGYVGYIREPVSYARSTFQERLKYAIGPGFTFGPEANLKLNYHRIVSRLDRLAGRDAVQVFPFERGLFPHGDVVRHFLGIAGLDAAAIPIRRVNESLSGTAVKALYCYRRLQVANDLEIEHDASRAAFIEALAAIRGPAFELHPEIEARIAAANTHILDWSETRMKHRLRLPEPSDERQGIREEADLMRFDPAEREELDRWAGTLGLRAPVARDGAEGVADLLADLRLGRAGRRRAAAS